LLGLSKAITVVRSASLIKEIPGIIQLTVLGEEVVDRTAETGDEP
jgi:hypothetical protein